MYPSICRVRTPDATPHGALQDLLQCGILAGGGGRGAKVSRASPFWTLGTSGLIAILALLALHESIRLLRRVQRFICQAGMEVVLGTSLILLVKKTRSLHQIRLHGFHGKILKLTKVKRVSNDASHGLALGDKQLGIKVSASDVRRSPPLCLWRMTGTPADWHLTDIEAVGNVSVESKLRLRGGAAWMFRANRKFNSSFSKQWIGEMPRLVKLKLQKK